MEARHLDGDKANNRDTNLQWGTPKENALDKLRHGTARSGSLSHLAKLSEDDVATIIAISNGRNHIALSKRFGVHRLTIDRAVRGETWRHVEREQAKQDGVPRPINLAEKDNHDCD